jgi:hypothetical protein
MFKKGEIRMNMSVGFPFAASVFSTNQAGVRWRESMRNRHRRGIQEEG